MSWIHLTQRRVHRWAPVNTVIVRGGETFLCLTDSAPCSYACTVMNSKYTDIYTAHISQ